jgi:hypothetical protein
VEDHLQGGKDVGDKEVVVFFLEEMSLRAIAYSKHFKLSMKNRLPEMKSRIGV